MPASGHMDKNEALLSITENNKLSLTGNKNCHWLIISEMGWTASK